MARRLLVSAAMASESEIPLRTFGGGPRLSEQELRAFERQHGLALPPSYRRFLGETNGGQPERDLFELRVGGEPRAVRIRFFFGLETPTGPCHLGWCRATLANRLAHDLLAIGTTDTANKICISLSAQTVSHWDGQTSALHLVATSFDVFARSLRRDAWSPKPNGSIWSTGKR